MSNQTDTSWFWPILDEYRDSRGLGIEETEHEWVRSSDNTQEVIDQVIQNKQWRLSPKDERATRFMLQVLESFYHPNDAFTYLEFGVCFGTTIATVMKRFSAARGIGFEMNPSRFAVSKWLADRVGDEFDLQGRLSIRQEDILKTDLPPASVDVVFMDTNHRYPDDYEYIMHVLQSGVLRDGFLFLGDDPMHTGTQLARERFMREHGQEYRIITRPDKNLWWFFRKPGARHSKSPLH